MTDKKGDGMSFRKHVTGAALAAFLAGSVFASHAFAENPAPVTATARLDDIVSRGKIRVGTTGDYRPFTFLNKDTGKYEGYDIDVAQALGKAMGVEVEFVATKWPDLAKDFAADKFDIAMGGVSITLARQKIGFFSTPIMREGKTPIARCADKDKFATVKDIDQPATKVIVNPGGTNEAFARGNFKAADIRVHNDNVTIFEEIATGKADVMVTDASETLFQQKLHPGVLCAIHPDAPFNFAEKAYWMQRDVALKDFVNQWLHIATETSEIKAIYAKWFE
jgi:cyclohexadienyl dehydratase